MLYCCSLYQLFSLCRLVWLDSTLDFASLLLASSSSQVGDAQSFHGMFATGFTPVLLQLLESSLIKNFERGQLASCANLDVSRQHAAPWSLFLCENIIIDELVLPPGSRQRLHNAKELQLDD